MRGPSTRTTRLLPCVALLLLAGTGAAPVAAQAGAAATFTVRIENVARRVLVLPNGREADIPLSPGVWAVHTGANPLFTPGEGQAPPGLEALAEAGMAAALVPHLQTHGRVRTSGVFERPEGRPRGSMSSARADGGGANASRMLMPGQHFEFTIAAAPGDRLSFATMLSQSNDGLVATGPEGIALFDAAGRPLSGDVTRLVALWDAGTEVNEEPGFGRNQGLRQGAAHAGDPERRPVRPLAEAEYGERWPRVEQIVRVTLTPRK